MFDIGFSEILLIFGLALIVLGPEKLPRVASQVGRWIGRARGMARQFREQLEEEVNLEEARKTRPPAIAQASPAPAPAVAAQSPAAIEPPPAPVASTGQDVDPPTEAVAQPEQSAVTVDTAASVASEAVQPSAQPEPTPEYPDWYSHAHPTDAEGRPLSSSTNEPPATGSGQHDWVGGSASDAGVTPTDKPAQGTTAAGYAPPHERGI